MNALERGLDGPYVGLEPFDIEHSDYFFGRALDAAVLADNVLARQIVVLYGASGVGKSSLLNAAFPAALEEQEAVVRVVTRREWHEPDTLMRWLKGISECPGNDPKRPLILVLDQFEEYFLYPNEIQIDLFCGALASLLARRNLEVHLLFSLRDDALHRLDHLRRHLPGLLDTTIELRHLDDAAVREAVVCPLAVWSRRPERATAAPVGLDQDFVDALIAQLRPKDNNGNAIAGGRIELAYLQLTLQRIWEAEGGTNATWLHTHTLTEDLKGVSEISRRHVEEVISGLSKADQEVCSIVFDRLVTPSGGKILYKLSDLSEVVRLSASALDQVRAPLSASALDQVLAPLARGRTRLLHTVVLSGKEGVHGYEILHDILARPILMWREAYTAQSERRRAARAAWRNGLVATMVLLTIWFVFTAYSASRLANLRRLEATRVRLTAKAESELAKTFGGADATALRFMLAAHALEKAASEEGDQQSAESLRGVGKALFRVPSFLRSYEVDGLPTAIAVSSDEKRLAIATDQGDIFFWRRDRTSQVTKVEAHLAPPVSALAISQSGAYVVSGGYDGQVYVHSFDAPKERRQLKHPTAVPEEVIALAIAPEERFIVGAVGSSGGYLWPREADVQKGFGTPIPLALQKRGSAIAVADGGRSIVMAAGSRLYAWNVENVLRNGERGVQTRPEVLQDFKDKAIRSLASLSTGRRLAVGFDSGELAIVQLEKGTAAKFGQPKDGGTKSPISVVRDVHRSAEQWVVTGDERGRVAIWKIGSGGKVGEARWLDQVSTKGIVDIATLAGEGRIEIAGSDRVVREWALDSTALDSAFSWRPFQSAQLVSDPRWTEDGPVALFWTGSKLGIAGLADNGFSRILQDGISEEVLALALSLNGSYAAAGTRGSGFIVWKIGSGAAPTSVAKRIDTGAAEIMAFSADERMLATSGAGGVIHVWNLREQSSADPIVVSTGEDVVTALAFANDGSLFAGASSGAIHSINLKVGSNRIRHVFQGRSGSVTALTFAEGAGRLISAHSVSRDGRRQGELRLWDPAVESGTPIGITLVGKPAHRLEAMGRESFLAATSADGDVTVWQLARDAAGLSALWPLYAVQAEVTSNQDLDVLQAASLGYLEQDKAIWVVTPGLKTLGTAKRWSAPNVWTSRLCMQLRSWEISDADWAPYQSAAVGKPPSLCSQERQEHG